MDADRYRVRCVPPAELGPVLRSARLRQGLGVREAARAAGVSHSHLINLEAGRRTPSRSVAEALIRVLLLDDASGELLRGAALDDVGRDHPNRRRRAA